MRICAIEEDREKRFKELKDLLLARDYKPKVIESAIPKATNESKMLWPDGPTVQSTDRKKQLRTRD